MGHRITLLTEQNLRGLVKLDGALLDEVEKAFLALAEGAVTMPPILSMEMPEANAEVDVKTAYIPGLDGFAIKVSPGFFNNPSLGLASLNGLMILFSAKTGLVEALLLDNGYLTDVRTAAAGGIAARYLAPKKVTMAGVLGTGVQARLQMQAAYLARPFESLLVWGRDREKARACAADLAESLGVRTDACDDPGELVSRCQLVVTTTPARSPILQSEWLHPGLHITAMGSDQAGKNEIDPVVFKELSAYIPDSLNQCEALGELRSALERGEVAAGSSFNELGAVIAEPSLGRRSDEDITLCDLTGTGAQDTVIATFAFEAACKAGAGRIIES